MNLQFLKPEFLWFLLILLIPIIIHLFNFRKYKKIYFSNISFLENLQAENKSKSNLKKILQLISRMLCFSLLVLAFSQPILKDTNEKIQKEKIQKEYTIYIDNSYSMNIEGAQGVNIQVAKQKAISIIANMPISSRFNILTNIISNINLSKDQAIKTIQDIETNAKVSKLSDIFKKSQQINYSNNDVDKKLLVISDFQKNSCDINKIKLDTNLQVILIPLKPNKINNLYVDTCYFKNPEHRYKQIDTLLVKIKNSSKEDFSNIPINLYLNDSLKLTHSFSVKSESESLIELKYKNTRNGFIQAKLSINDYPISYDNDMFFNYNISANKKILIINSSDKNKYLNALFTKENNFHTKNINIKNYNKENINKYQLVILNKTNKIENAFANKISNYIRQGGSVLLVPGTMLEPSVNFFLKSINSDYFGKIIHNKQRISFVEKNSDVYKQSFRSLKKDALMPMVYKYYRLKQTSSSLSENIWIGENNSVFMSHTKLSSGNCYVLACDLDVKWTNVLTHKIFVPALWNIAHKNINTNKLYYVISEDNKINITHKPLNKELIHIVNAKLKIDIIPEHKVSNNQEAFLLTHEQIHKAANYQLQVNAQTFAVSSFNYSRDESALYFHSLADIESFFPKSMKILASTDKDTDWEQEIVMLNRGVGLWRYLLVLSILFFILEFYLSKNYK